MKISTSIIVFLVLFFNNVLAQNNYYISGTITDNSSGEQLVNVIVYNTKTKNAVVSNNFGYYNINSADKEVELVYSHLGYKKIIKNFKLTKDSIHNISLESDPNILDDVVINAPKPERVSAQTGIITLKKDIIKKTPTLLGEPDLLKALQLLPGVKGGIEGTGGIYIRGGSPDQNLILLDGLPLYNTMHAFGFVSSFNTNSISSFTFYKGGIPARYNGRLSSVIDVKMKEGNLKKISGEASFGLISSSVTLEGPIIKDRTSFIISFRRTLYDIILKPFKNSEIPGFYFYDLNTKINHRINKNNRIYFSLYNGEDITKTNYNNSSNDFSSKYKSSDFLGWGNLTSILRWNTIINSNLFLNSSIFYSKYQFKLEQKKVETFANNGILSDYLNQYTSGINDFGGKIDLEYSYSEKQTFRGGIGFTNHEFNPGLRILVDPQDSTIASVDTTFGNNKVNINETFFYFEDDLKFGRLNINIGINYSLFLLENSNYMHLQPRIALQYQIHPKLSTKLSYGELNQYLHLLSNTTLGLPTDLWLPSTKKVKPQEAQQYSLGFYYDISKGYNLSLEVYYKKMKNLIEYKEGASFYQINQSWEDLIEVGDGLSKGIELFFQKETGRLTGWIGTTLSKTDRKFKGLNNGKIFPFRYDSRFDVSIVSFYKLSDRVNLSAAWVFHSGYAITLAKEKIEKFPNDKTTSEWIPNYTSRNNFRTPAYHRLDVSIDFIKQKKRVNRTWSIGVYNLYNRLNPFYIYSDLDGKDPKIKQLTIFPILPYIKYSIKF